jgi:hypothetical protein
MTTISPKKNNANKKRGEVQRLIQLMRFKKIQPVDLSVLTKVSKRTIENTIWNNEEIGGRLLRSLHQNLGVSLDWLLAGSGEMFIDAAAAITPDQTSTTHQVSEMKYDYDNKTGGTDMTPLIRTLDYYDTDTLQDFWWLTALIAEKSLLQAGAMPNDDYSILDLYKLSQPIVLQRFKDVNLKMEASE